MKICSKCKTNKPLLEYSKNKNKKDGLHVQCKGCCSFKNKERYNFIKEIIKEKCNKYYYENKNEISKKSKLKPSYHKQNPGYYKKYRIENIDSINKYYLKWRNENRVQYRIRMQISYWVREKGILKNKKTESLLGYGFKELQNQIGIPLKGQEIDHKIPLSWFKKHTPINLLWSLENLHIVSENYNRAKSNSFCNVITLEYRNKIEKYIKHEFKEKLNMYNMNVQYDFDKIDNENMVSNKLFCTFTTKEGMEDLIEDLTSRYSILYNKMFVLEIKNKDEFVITYNIEDGNINNIPENTILVHRKKDSNTLYTINALNQLIKSLNGGVVDTNYKVDWQHYKNCILLTQHNELSQLNTQIHKIIKL